MKQETIERIRRFTEDREWDQFHTPVNLAKSISIEANELLECFQWSDTEYDLEHVKEELADVIVYCQNMLDRLGLDVDEIVNRKMDQNEAKYPVEKSRGSAAKYDRLEDAEPDFFEIPAFSAEDFIETEDQFSKARRYMHFMKNLDDYNLTSHEHNMALMLLYHNRTTPKRYVAFELDYLLLERLRAPEGSKEKEQLRKYFKVIKSVFTSAINAERRSVGTNDTAAVAGFKGKSSASQVLLSFKPDEDTVLKTEWFDRTCNLGNVRRVDIDSIVRKPGDAFIKFLEDWRRACQNTDSKAEGDVEPRT